MFIFGEAQNVRRKMLMNIPKTNQTLKSKTKFGFDDKILRKFDLWRNWITNDLVHSPP
jgi:hypothetical protein